MSEGSSILEPRRSFCEPFELARKERLLTSGLEKSHSVLAQILPEVQLSGAEISWEA